MGGYIRMMILQRAHVAVVLYPDIYIRGSTTVRKKYSRKICGGPSLLHRPGRNSPALESNQNVPVLERLHERRVHCQSHITRSLAECVHVGGRSPHNAASEIASSV